MADLQNPYRQLPSETGGQAYHMECEFCKEWGSMYSSAPFQHTADCPAGKLEQEEFAAMRKKPYFNSPEAEGRYASDIDWRGSPLYRIKGFLFGELNSLRTLIVVWGAVVLFGLGFAIYVIHHFIHKYW